MLSINIARFLRAHKKMINIFGTMSCGHEKQKIWGACVCCTWYKYAITVNVDGRRSTRQLVRRRIWFGFLCRSDSRSHNHTVCKLCACAARDRFGTGMRLWNRAGRKIRFIVEWVTAQSRKSPHILDQFLVLRCDFVWLETMIRGSFLCNWFAAQPYNQDGEGRAALYSSTAVVMEHQHTREDTIMRVGRIIIIPKQRNDDEKKNTKNKKKKKKEKKKWSTTKTYRKIFVSRFAVAVSITFILVRNICRALSFDWNWRRARR